MRTGTATPAARWVLALATAAQVLLALDFAIVNTALATIQQELHFSAAALQWVAAGYALTFGAFLLPSGRLADRFGVRRMLVIGLVLFGASSLTGGAAPDAVVLVASRLVQGVGAALTAPAAFALVGEAYPEPAARARAVSLFQSGNAVGGIAGVLLGGLLTSGLGWRSVLLVNPPIALLLVVLVLSRVTRSPAQPGTAVDLRGASALAIAIAALILGITESGAANPAAPVALVVAFLAGVAFVVIERRARHPMLPAALLARGRWAVIAAVLLLGGTMGGYAYLLALFLQQILGLSAAATGLAFLPATITGLAASTLLAPRLLTRFGATRTFAGALALLAAGQLILARLPDPSSYLLDVVPGILLTALGLGLAFPAAAFLITDDLPTGTRGVASALFATGQQVGAAIGLAVLAAIAAAVGPRAAAGFDAAFATSAAFPALGVGLAALTGARRSRRDRGAS